MGEAVNQHKKLAMGKPVAGTPKPSAPAGKFKKGGVARKGC